MTCNFFLTCNFILIVSLCWQLACQDYTAHLHMHGEMAEAHSPWRCSREKQ